MLFDSTMKYLQQSLDVTSLRHSVIASNIANADTPNYKAKHIPFKNILNLAQKNDITLDTTNSMHIKSNEGFKNIIKQDNDSYLQRNDKNNVNMDTEMILLAKNTILFNALTNMEKFKFNQYKDLIAANRNI